jgi:hypothetical protein
MPKLRLKQRLLSDVALRPGNGSSETTETFLYISAPKAVAERLRAFIFGRLFTPCPWTRRIEAHQKVLSPIRQLRIGNESIQDSHQ